jgi:hypothetical protein
VDGAGTISGRWALAAGRGAAKGCRICHGPALPGMRLCTQCKAALKRARQETVSELLPPPARAPSARSARRAAARQAVVETGSEHSGTRRREWRIAAIILCVAAAAGLAYAALRLARPPDSLPDGQAAAPATTPMSPGEPLARPLPEPAAGPASSVPAPTATKAAVPQEARHTPAPMPPPPAPPASSRSDAAAPAPTARAFTLFATAPEPPPPQPAVSPAPVAPPAPAPDRWQRMAEAISACGREGFLAGVICEQRVRLQYCDGHWGKVAQCPNGIANDHGQ